MKQTLTTARQNFETAFNSPLGFVGYTAALVVAYIVAYWGAAFGVLTVADGIAFVLAGQPIGLAGIAFGLVVIRFALAVHSEMVSGDMGIPPVTRLPAFAYSLTQTNYGR